MENLKQAKIIKMRMDNLPEKTWFTYYKLKRYGNSVRWGSLQANEMPYQAEQFWLTDDEFAGLVRDGRIKAGNNMEHTKIKHGLCETCGHYGDDCVGKPRNELLAAAKLALEYIDRLPLNMTPDGMLPPFYELTTAIAKEEGKL